MVNRSQQLHVKAPTKLPCIVPCIMTLSAKEKAIAVISGGIAAYSIYQETDSLPENVTMFDLILRSASADIKSMITPELVDEVFSYVAMARNS